MKYFLRPPCLVPLLVALSALAKGLVACNQEIINVDAVRYLNAAHLISQERFWEGVASSQFMPLLPFLIYGFHLLADNWTIAGQLVSILFLSLSVVPVYFLARALFDNRIALWTAAAFALSPPLAGYGAQILREPPFLFFFAWALYFAVQAFARGRSGDFAFAGIFAVLAAFCRLEGLLLPVVCGAWALILAWRSPAQRRTFLRGAAVIGLPFCVLLLLAAVGDAGFLRFDYVSTLVGDLFSGEGFRGFLNARQALAELENSAALPGGQWDNDFAQTARQFLPLIYLLALLWGLCDVLFVPFAFLAILALWRARKPGLGFIYFFLAVYLVAAGMFLLRNNMVSDRYLLSAVLPLFPFVGAGFQYLLERVGRDRRMAVSGLVALFILIPLAGSLREIEAGDPTIRLAGEWLAGQNFDGTTLLCNDERVPFYAGLWRADYMCHPGRDFRGMEALSRQQEIELMVIRVSARKRQDVALPDGYEVLKEFAGEKDAVIFLRRVRVPATADLT